MLQMPNSGETMVGANTGERERRQGEQEGIFIQFAFSSM